MASEIEHADSSSGVVIWVVVSGATVVGLVILGAGISHVRPHVSSAPGGGLNDMERFNAITEISHE